MMLIIYKAHDSDMQVQEEANYLRVLESQTTASYLEAQIMNEVQTLNLMRDTTGTNLTLE